MEIDQLLGDVGTLFQLGIRLLQALKLLVPRVGRLTAGLSRSDTRLTVLGQVLAPSRQLASVQPLATKPGTLLAIRQGISFGQQPLLLTSTEATSGTLLKARVGDNLVGIRHFLSP
ncbi:MAG: hypothetical protein U5L08_02650 [Xanthomonadales bacterium]|nr:hypothetical protein [Xanthomonadales bacterium]